MAALSDIVGSQKEAIRQTGKVLRIKGRVIPVSFTSTNLFARYEDGHVLSEEHLIDEPPHDGRMKIVEVYLQPKAVANPEATAEILNADIVVIGPGDLYTSLIPNLLVSGICEALKKTHAMLIFVVNLMTKYGQTYNFTASDHIYVLEKFIGNALDYVLINSGTLAESALHAYRKLHEKPVADDLTSGSYYKIIRKKFASQNILPKSKSDKLVRSLIRHDSDKLANAVLEILNS